MLIAAAGAAGCALALKGIAFASGPWKLSKDDEAFLDDLERQGCLYFWEQASPKTGQALDRARNDLGGALDPRRMASIASTGFGLTALCIADRRGYLPHAQIVERVKTTLAWHLNSMPEVHGFFYHFTDIETGERYHRTELSSIDTSLLLCGVLTTRAYFDDPHIQSLAQQIYERVDWPWMLNGGETFSMGWKPDTGFLTARWSRYCELMMIYLLAIGSPTHAVAPVYWNNFTRPVMHYAGFDYIGGRSPLFVHQYAQGFLPFLSGVVQRGLLGHYGLRLREGLYRVGRTAGTGTSRRDCCAVSGGGFAGLRACRLPFSIARDALEMGKAGLGTIRLCRRLPSRRQLV
jgi:hypothetical protein